MSLTLNQALRIATATLAEGQRQRFAPLCVAVLDPGARPLALLRDERASINRPEIATAKAAGCLGMGVGGRELARRAQAMPAFFATLAAILPDGIAPVPGGVLIRDAAGALIGAVGVSGDTSDKDEICALAGIGAAGLTADSGQ
ncbi:heme-binding protein [Sphingomonas sp. MMSM20]|uniref:GlcG/HbpS family heme-binding protein n=1 Tax=Sphingomonas lycopersici TaxID=2951807 RepID=UPI00223852BF|nr:heme-binding protein [Sphingomonas lycopersici]